MSSSKLQIDNGIVKDDLNCVKCKSVPKDACLVPCGCRFCRICINDLISTGVEFCPGSSEECESSPLSQSVTDYRANRNISRLQIKCSNNGCVHACQLANMDEHLRVCPRKSIECPFRELGCTQDRLAAEEMNAHLQRESLKHSEILIGMINNVNNEMEGSKRKIELLNKAHEDNKLQVENLIEVDDVNMRNIDSLKDMCRKYKMVMLEKANENSKTQVEVMNESDENNVEKFEVQKKDYICHKDKINMFEKTSEINKQTMNILKKENKTENEAQKKKMENKKREFERLMTANEDNKKEIEMLKCDLERKNEQIKSIMEEMKLMKIENKECRDRMTTLLEETRVSSNTKMIEYVDSGVTAIKRNIQLINQGTQSIKADIESMKAETKVLGEQVDARLDWLLYNGVCNLSSIFHGAVHPYKYQLASIRKKGNSLRIHLRIHHEDRDENLQWPFCGTVTITVMDQVCPLYCLSVTKQCRIKKPTSQMYNYSAPFLFLYSELIAAGVDLHDFQLRVTCSITLSPNMAQLPAQK